MCDTVLRRLPDLAAWCFRCDTCGTWAADLPVAINQDASPIDEGTRERGLRHLRRRTSRQVLERIRRAGPPGRLLLDIGSAHGWFTRAASSAGFDAIGLEPDEAVARDSVAPTRVGYFPDALQEAERFAVVTFNDVLEHMEDPRQVVTACRDHLGPRGLLSVNIPSSEGLLFRGAVAARRRGRATELFGRLWQEGLPSPHLWYFNKEQLTRLCTDEGFDLVDTGRLPGMTWRGLWSRAHMDRRPTVQTTAGVAVGALTAPVLNRGGDIMHLVFRTRG